ncbi:GFA family protein [Sphingomonas sp.]|jgi:hypothetical protein|uniref:GFA family protein n=1 Tax=Sphingomonas sp. TaxID=28214 RepID=UPI0039C97FD9
MPDAHCACGALTVSIAAYSPAVVICHCTACRRRSGSSFGVGMYVPIGSVAITGPHSEFARTAASGGMFRNQFCPTCGSTVFWMTDKHPGAIGIAYGAFATDDLPPPVRSVWEEGAHDWVSLPASIQHFRQGRP